MSSLPVIHFYSNSNKLVFRFRTITSAYYRGADGIIIVYDVTDADSFKHVDEWVQEVNKYAAPTTCKLLIGNKCDDVNKIQVTSEEARKKAQELGLSFIETSAKDAIGVEDAFTLLSSELIQIELVIFFCTYIFLLNSTIVPIESSSHQIHHLLDPSLNHHYIMKYF